MGKNSPAAPHRWWEHRRDHLRPLLVQSIPLEGTKGQQGHLHGVGFGDSSAEGTPRTPVPSAPLSLKCATVQSY